MDKYILTDAMGNVLVISPMSLEDIKILAKEFLEEDCFIHLFLEKITFVDEITLDNVDNLWYNICKERNKKWIIIKF